MNKFNRFLRLFFNLYIRIRLKNRTFTLISSNCNGCCILRDLGLKFNTPFVNLFIGPADFIKLCSNLVHYLHCELTFISGAEEGLSYPVGKLDDIKIYFMHYSSEEEALSLWNKRKERINFNDIFLLFSDRGGCTYDMLKAYDALEYENKVVFCNREYPEIKSAVYIPGFETQESVGICLDYKSSFTYKKYYDAFDYVSWFNGGTMG